MISRIAAALVGIQPAGATDQLWKAQAEWNPPARYDRPFNGTTYLYQHPPRDVPQACATLFKQAGVNLPVSNRQRGCAVRQGDQCWIVSLDRPAYGTTPEAVIRHERGHCNGWHSSHPE